MITDNPDHPDINQDRGDGQNKAYLVLSEAERAKGYVRPVRVSYVHVGSRPTYPLRELTPDEHERYDQYGYIRSEEYPPGAALVGRFWTAKQLASGCQTLTTMGRALAETYARDPKFYGYTFCCGCSQHFPVDEFVWDGTDLRVGG